MTREELHAVNQAAAIKLKPMIDSNYPSKQFVAIAEGKIVADDADFDQLLTKLRKSGIEMMDTLIERAGDQTADYVNIV
jgi:hypothetical protein